MSKRRRLLTSPMGLLGSMESPRLGIALIAFIATVLVGIGLLLINGRFLLAPGTHIELPCVGHSLPVGTLTDDVLSVGQNGTCYYEGQVFTLETLPDVLQKSALNSEYNATLLIKGDRSTSIETLLTICEWAKNSGFKSIQIAATVNQSKFDPIWD